jgi:hypothetical protein
MATSINTQTFVQTVHGFGTAVDLNPATLAGTSVNLDVSQAPASTSFTAGTGVGNVFLFAGRKEAFTNLGFFFSLQGTVTSGNFSTATLPLGANDFHTSLAQAGAQDGSNGRLEFKKLTQAYPANFTVDLPVFTVDSITPADTGGMIDSVAWTLTGSAGSFDLYSVEIHSGLSAVTQTVEWTLNFPSTTASPVALPDLPSDLGTVK